jgi:TolB-like protein/DNA-binding winged helix-turn-helix (wHTH) protein
VTFGVARFAEFELDRGRYQLRRGDRVVPLEKIPMELLTLLVESEGQLVTRDQIIARIWGKDVFLDTEHGINTAVRKIRHALDDDPEQPRFVQTVTGRGYRFIAPLASTVEARRNGDSGLQGSLAAQPRAEVVATGSEVATPTAAAQPVANPPRFASTAGIVFLAILGLALLVAALLGFNVRGWRDRLIGSASSQRIHSLAVLPLENLSGDPTQDYFADGMTDEIITMIAQNAELSVISRTSVMQYKKEKAHRSLHEIARELGVDGILEGSVGRFGNRIHVNAQLIYAPTDTHMWAESYDRDVSEINSLQTELAQTIARQVGLKVSASAKPAKLINPDAHDSYLLGRYYWFAGDNEKSRSYFRKAIDQQPDYAAAWSGLADSFTMSAVGGEQPPLRVMPQAEEAARKALEFDDSVAEAHNTIASIDLFYRWDLLAADKESARAIQLNPSYAEGHHLRSYVLRSLNRLDEALQEQKKATELDPYARPTALAYALLRVRQFDAALNEARIRLEAQPNDVELHYLLSWVYLRKGMEKEGEQEMEVALRLSGQQKEADEDRRIFERGGGRAVQEHFLNDAKQRAAREYVPPLEMAYGTGALGRKEETLHYLELAYQERAPFIVFIQSHPSFDFVHSEPRYRAIVNKVGLPPAY